MIYDLSFNVDTYLRVEYPYMLAEKISRYNLLTNIAGVSSSSVSEAGPIFDMCVSCHIKLI